jgi:hypothetical protein
MEQGSTGLVLPEVMNRGRLFYVWNIFHACRTEDQYNEETDKGSHGILDMIPYIKQLVRYILNIQYESRAVVLHIHAARFI